MAKFHLDENYLEREPLMIKDFPLMQLGRQYCEPAQADGLHKHGNLFELTVVTEGEGVVYTNGVANKVARGDIYLSFPYELHQIISSSNAPLHFDFFAFRPDQAHFQEEFFELSKLYAPNNRIVRDERIVSLIGEAIAEFIGKQTGFEEMLYCQFRQILLYILRAFKSLKSSLSSVGTVQPKAFCYQIMNYIDTHIYAMKNLQEMAVAFNYNYSYLSSLFKETTGGSLADYHRKKKLETALSLLKEEMSVSQIAELLHYSSPYAFSRAFKAEYGVAPKRFALQEKQKKS